MSLVLMGGILTALFIGNWIDIDKTEKKNKEAGL